ncbi:hypothetical protein CRG98_028628 [Punica granatum]|uniref:Uncharacterized protein n=1 Tax=Punica granatum TaxID=22663 RepID=A0A2I0J442_PUNGR|nr:hypothetical protein CRG98_028628 [Punica granatum]
MPGLGNLSLGTPGLGPSSVRPMSLPLLTQRASLFSLDQSRMSFPLLVRGLGKPDLGLMSLPPFPTSLDPPGTGFRFNEPPPLSLVWARWPRPLFAKSGPVGSRPARFGSVESRPNEPRPFSPGHTSLPPSRRSRSAGSRLDKPPPFSPYLGLSGLGSTSLPLLIGSAPVGSRSVESRPDEPRPFSPTLSPWSLGCWV